MAKIGDDLHQVEGLRRRVRRRPQYLAEPIVDRAEHRRAETAGFQDRFDEIGGGRLAVGAGHADHRDPPGGKTVESRRHLCHRQPAVADADADDMRRQIAGLLHDHGRCALFHRLVDKAVPVDLLAPQCEEDTARFHLARVVGEVARIDRSIRRSACLQRGYVRDQACQLHGCLSPYVVRFSVYRRKAHSNFTSVLNGFAG